MAEQPEQPAQDPDRAVDVGHDQVPARPQHAPDLREPGALEVGLLVFLFLGLTVWSAVVAALLLVCPLIIGWGAWIASRRKPPPVRGGKPPFVSAE
jgi:hypothetical protein